jgi:hypothetical protein
MPDNPELVERYAAKAHQIILDMRHDGIRDEVIYFVFNKAARDLEMRITAKGELNSGDVEKP